jgi:signal peptidase II
VIEQPAATAAPKVRRVRLFAVVAALVLALDLVSKVIVAAQLPITHEPVRILSGIIYLDQTRNSGAAFSLGAGFTVLLTVVALAVVVVILRTAGRLRSPGWACALGLVLGGALGNLTDRVFREPGVLRGHVVDWISLFGPDAKYWPIFNFADAGIVCGAILAGILVAFGVEFDGSSARHRSRA